MKGARFIAGAVCRMCGATDRIVLEEHEAIRVQRCVACGHEESIVGEPDAAARGDDHVAPARVRIIPSTQRD